MPIELPKADVDALMAASQNGANAKMTVDLEKQLITGPDGIEIAFDVDSFRKHCLIEGLDDIGLTLQKADKISAYEAKRDAQAWS